MKKLMMLGLCLMGVAGAQGQVQWEYAEYSESTIGGTTTYFLILGKPNPNVDTFAKQSVQEVGQGLKCPTPTNNLPQLFDCFGKQGWEMVSASHSGKDISVFFKRPVK